MDDTRGNFAKIPTDFWIPETQHPQFPFINDYAL